jgi:hypothetical protein
MANIVSETTWHGNPRPIESYVTTVYDSAVASPYYIDGRDVPVHNTYNTSIPLSDLAPAASISVAGPTLVVQGAVGGLWPVGSALNVAITVTGGTNISTSIVNQIQTLSPDQFAALVADTLNTLGAGDVQCASDGELVNISALGAVTALTITTWAVAV